MMSQKRFVLRLIPWFILIVLTATGCATYQPPVIPPNTASLTPREVVSDYYESLAEHNMSKAQRFLSPKLIHYYRSTADGLQNLKKISDIQVSAPTTIQLKNKTEVQVTATFMAEYYHVRRKSNGMQTRFLFLGRSGDNQPWLIESIGLGP